MKLKGKILSFSVPPLIGSAILIMIVVSMRVTSLMETEIQSSLQATAYVYRDAISDIECNDYFIGDDGSLMNGEEYNVSEDTEMIDYLAETTGIILTTFLGDTRFVTSLTDEAGNRMIGSKAGASAVETVLNNGQEYFAKGIDLGGTKYYGYYIPLYNGESSSFGDVSDVVGMIFAGMDSSVVSSTVSNVVINTSIIVLIIVALITALDWMLANNMAKRFTASTKVIETAATGDLTSEIGVSLLRTGDEAGDIARSVNELQLKFTDAFRSIIKEGNNVNESAKALEIAADECTHIIAQVETAVNDISDGASGQAADTTAATGKVIEMGNLVQATNENVDTLIAISDKMEKEGHDATATLEKLEKVNVETKRAIDDIYRQTNTTNESALKINEAVSLITAIAEETNLLSLNASIEAARAGEQGRGFAVVASQIQKLAEQSNESAKTIEEIITTLISDSEKSVKTMEEVKEIMERQSEMVTETGTIFSEVIGGITSSKESINEIAGNMVSLNSSREEVVDLVSNLSAIAEENAASTEETSASVSEVSSSIQQVSDNAMALKEIAVKLSDLVSKYKING